MPCPPRMRGCRQDCLHRRLVEDYRDARQAWEDQLEDATGHTYVPGLVTQQRRAARRGGRNEVDDFVEAVPPVTFRDALVDARKGREL